MTELWITVEALPGCSLDTAIEQAIALAGRLGVGVVLPFNGINLRVKSESTATEIMAAYRRESENRRHRAKLAARES